MCARLTDTTSKLLRGSVTELRVKVFSNFLQAPTLSASGVHREGVLLDLDCPNAADVLIKVNENDVILLI